MLHVGLALLGAKTDLKGVLGLNSCVTISVINGTPGHLTCDGTDKRVGATAGAGIEYGFTPNWSAKVEYRYVAAASLELSHINEVLVGVNYRFGGPCKSGSVLIGNCCLFSRHFVAFVPQRFR